VADAIEVSMMDSADKEATLRFDGAVLECFGPGGSSLSNFPPSIRFLARHLTVELQAYKKARVGWSRDSEGDHYHLRLAVPGAPDWKLAASPVELDLVALEPLLDALRSAGASVTHE
jgi:hypothetical protein